MKFGIHNPSWVFGPDPTEAFERVKAKAQWAENARLRLPAAVIWDQYRRIGVGASRDER
jgi:hypothetical protein